MSDYARIATCVSGRRTTPAAGSCASSWPSIPNCEIRLGIPAFVNGFVLNPIFLIAWRDLHAHLAARACCLGYAEVRPTAAAELLGTVVVAWVLAGVAGLAAAVLLPPLAGVYDGWQRMAADWEAAARRRLEKRAAEAAEQNRLARAREHEAYLASLPPPPPPPTKEQLLAEAHAERETDMALARSITEPTKRMLAERAADRRHDTRVQEIMGQ